MALNMLVTACIPCSNMYNVLTAKYKGAGASPDG